MDRTITTHRCHFFLLPQFTSKICFSATNYGILHYIKTCTSQNFKPCFVHFFSLFVKTTKQTLNSWNAEEILAGPHFFPVIQLTPARHPVQVHWRQQGLYHPIRLSRKGAPGAKVPLNLGPRLVEGCTEQLEVEEEVKECTRRRGDQEGGKRRCRPLLQELRFKRWAKLLAQSSWTNSVQYEIQNIPVRGKQVIFWQKLPKKYLEVPKKFPIKASQVLIAICVI